jgi:ParB family chromosome partitioning protein
LSAQKIKKSGLPKNVGMRHDDHFVDLISTKSAGPKIRMISIEKIDPNPNQPRSELGSIDDLRASIKEKGVLEPILVRPKEGRYEIIAGERRFRASREIGLEELPCIEMHVEDNEAMEISLIENLQRKDLDVFEEADGLKSLTEIYDYNHDEIAKKIGKARSTVTEVLQISKIPIELRDLCRASQITSRSTLIEIAKQKTHEDMKLLIEQIQYRELRREDTRELSKKLKGTDQKRQKRYVFNFKPNNKDTYRLRMEFKSQKVSKKEIIDILTEIIKKLKENSKL